MLNKLLLLLVILLVGCTYVATETPSPTAAIATQTATFTPEPSATASITPTATLAFPIAMTPNTSLWGTNVLSNACHKVSTIFLLWPYQLLRIDFPDVYDACIAKGVLP